MSLQLSVWLFGAMHKGCMFLAADELRSQRLDDSHKLSVSNSKLKRDDTGVQQLDGYISAS